MGTDAIRRTISVQATPEIAFKVFTERLGTWWPLERYHIGPVPAVSAHIEPRVGGRWYERGTDGTETPWGKVLQWDPPKRLVLTWDIGADWKFDGQLQTEVEVRFIEDGKERTRVELEHRKLDRYGDKANQMRAIFDSPQGWPAILDSFSKTNH